ncbi:MAG: PBP1A family penicillin-binding protein [Clostridia bacterium]|nr:PBP1A family penicillin-binding protein [Clostridia bacterium]
MRGRVIKTTLLLAAGALVAWGAGFFIQSWALLDLDRITAQPLSSVVYNRDGEAAEILSGYQDRTRVELENIPDYVKNAFLAAEDARFYSHHGIDLYRVGGALLTNIRSGGYSQGASTITQQLIKLTHLSSVKTIERKAREAILAVRLELTLTKDEILEAYLNTVYFGSGVYGLEAAARKFLGVEAGNLSLEQGAFLAGLIKSPSGYDPYTRYDKAMARRDMILSSMEEYGYINARQRDEAMAVKVEIMPEEERSYALWYAEAAADEAADILAISYDELLSGGYGIYTALDENMQKSAQELFDDDANFPSNASDGTPVQSALVCVDVNTGEVVSVTGGRNRSVSRGLNRAIDISRQPGSAFKPISVYAAAVDGYSYMPTSFIDDTRREFEGGYSPSNVSGNYYGEVTLREALSRSLNVATVDLISRVGVGAAVEYAKRAGIDMSAEGENLSIALGSLTKGVSPIDMAAAYAALANGGQSVEPHFVRTIVNSEGEVLYEYTRRYARVMSASSARLVTDMLITAAQTGTARALSELPFTAAGKTGTVGEGASGNRDVWNVSYTPKLSVCVWMGFDEPGADKCMPDSVTGSSHPTRLAAKYMKENAASFDGGEFDTPDNLITVPIDTKALEESHKAMLISEFTPKSHTQNELFFRTNAPTAVSNAWKVPSQVFDLYVVREGSNANIRFTAVDDYALYRIYRHGDGGDELIFETSGEAGQQISLDLTNHSSSDGYYVAPVEKTLAQEGIELAGKRSSIVYEAKTLDWDAQTSGEREIIEQSPLFG